MKTCCPHCGITVSGDMVTICDHIQACGRSAPAAKKPKKAKPVKAPRPTSSGYRPILLPIGFDLHHPVLSQNAHVGMHWTAKNKEKLAWVADLEPQVRDRQLINARFAWSEWIITRYIGKGQREFDFANLVGGCKQLVDALTTLNVIEDDKPQFFDCIYRQVRNIAPGVYGTIELVSIDH